MFVTLHINELRLLSKNWSWRAEKTIVDSKRRYSKMANCTVQGELKTDHLRIFDFLVIEISVCFVTWAKETIDLLSVHEFQLASKL